MIPRLFDVTIIRPTGNIIVQCEAQTHEQALVTVSPGCYSITGRLSQRAAFVTCVLTGIRFTYYHR
jgi:hypothetical protein